jgi:hypothetical protein
VRGEEDDWDGGIGGEDLPKIACGCRHGRHDENGVRFQLRQPAACGVSAAVIVHEAQIGDIAYRLDRLGDAASEYLPVAGVIRRHDFVEERHVASNDRDAGTEPHTFSLRAP